MTRRMGPKATALTIAAVAVIGIAGWRLGLWGSTTKPVPVRVPELSASAALGQKTFNQNCAACHGVNAAGSDRGPPLVHDIYNPGHHTDAAFYLAAQRGTRQHHWRFGNMPPQPQVSRKQVSAIIRFVRELQRANGIKYEKHQM